MEKSYLIDQIWSNRAVLKYKDSKTNLGTLEVSELESMYALIPNNATQEPDATEPDAPSSNITTLTTTQGVEVPVVMLPLVRVEGLSLYFQFGEKRVLISNAQYVNSFNKGLIQIGELMPFNFNLGMSSFVPTVAGYLQPYSNQFKAEERKVLSEEEKTAGKLLSSFVEGLMSDIQSDKNISIQLEMYRLDAIAGTKKGSAERADVLKRFSAEVVEQKASVFTSKIKALFA
jgi:hypothetical protein